MIACCIFPRAKEFGKFASIWCNMSVVGFLIHGVKQKTSSFYSFLNVCQVIWYQRKSSKIALSLLLFLSLFLPLLQTVVAFLRAVLRMTAVGGVLVVLCTET